MAPDMHSMEQHYTAQAQAHGLAPSSTMDDATTRALETALILQVIARARQTTADARVTGHPSPPPRFETLVDVGCGNGYTLAEVLRAFPGLGLLGLEYTPALRALATHRFAAVPTVRIDQGDVRALDLPDGCMDLVYTQRVLINLPDLDAQTRALCELRRILRPGGWLLLVEAFVEPFERLNTARAEFGLPPLMAPTHNRYLHQGQLEGMESTATRLPETTVPRRFCSTHYYVSRVLHPALLNGRPFVRNGPCVRFLDAALPPAVGDYGVIQAVGWQKGTA